MHPHEVAKALGMAKPAVAPAKALVTVSANSLRFMATPLVQGLWVYEAD